MSRRKVNNHIGHKMESCFTFNDHLKQSFVCKSEAIM